MLLVTFHGGSGGVTNVYAYNTTTRQLNTSTAMANVQLSKSELRGMVYANSYLYLVDGCKKTSKIMCFQPPAAESSTYTFDYISDFLDAAVLSQDGRFENSISHPYAMVFDGQGSCYVANQDTNVVARAKVASNFQTAAIEKGCQSQYLIGLSGICPNGNCIYLNGTFVASQEGTLPDVEVAATNVPSQYGGLSVSFAENSGKQKVQNSVRDVAIAGSVLLVCDEPSKLIRLYSLPDGAYIGSSPTLPASPTHLSVQPSGLYVSAGNQIYWSALTSTPTPTSLSFTSVLTAPPSTPTYKVGGITFNTDASTVYVVFQIGAGQTGSGAVYSYTMQGNATGAAPVFASGSLFATLTDDTPEFVLFMPDP